jgi:deazaflavin-dependent oxidoreductase (nitroreductase family)
MSTTSRRAMRFLWRSHHFWWRVSGGRLGTKMAGMPVIELVTTGRRSGERRSVLLSCMDHPEGYVVVASNAGADAHPAWWLNLEASPEATVRRAGSEEAVRARELEGAERDELWSAFVAAYRGYEGYAGATDREIPVVLLERVTQAKG